MTLSTRQYFSMKNFVAKTLQNSEMLGPAILCLTKSENISAIAE